MLQGLSLISIPNPPSLPPHSLSLRTSIRCYSSSSSSTSTSTSPESLAAADSSSSGDLSARVRRQLRNERRERNAAASGSWREEVEERLARRRKKEYSSWKEKLNLDNLAKLGPRWWTVRVARVNGQETADRLARTLARGFPEMEFKVYFPAVREKKKLKNGTYSEKTNPLFPGCVFLECVLNKEVHDYIRECDGVGGFLGSKVGNTKRQINKPKPVVAEEMEKIFQQVKEEQQNFDQAFEREQQEQNFNYDVDSRSPKSNKVTNTKGQLGKDLGHSGNVPLAGGDIEYLVPGATVRILSGPFVEFTGRLKDLDYSNKKATVGFTLFGKESSVDLEVEQLAAETNDSWACLLVRGWLTKKNFKFALYSSKIRLTC